MLKRSHYGKSPLPKAKTASRPWPKRRFVSLEEKLTEAFVRVRWELAQSFPRLPPNARQIRTSGYPPLPTPQQPLRCDAPARRGRILPQSGHSNAATICPSPPRPAIHVFAATQLARCLHLLHLGIADREHLPESSCGLHPSKRTSPCSLSHRDLNHPLGASANCPRRRNSALLLPSVCPHRTNREGSSAKSPRSANHQAKLPAIVKAALQKDRCPPSATSCPCRWKSARRPLLPQTTHPS